MLAAELNLHQPAEAQQICISFVANNTTAGSENGCQMRRMIAHSLRSAGPIQDWLKHNQSPDPPAMRLIKPANQSKNHLSLHRNDQLVNWVDRTIAQAGHHVPIAANDTINESLAGAHPNLQHDLGNS